MGRHRLDTAPERGGRRTTAVRGGLLGVSVAVALATAAVTTGMVPVGGSFPYVGVQEDSDGGSRTEAKASPSPENTPRQQGGLANLSGRTPSGAGTSPSGTPSASPSATPPPSASPSPTASASAPASPKAADTPPAVPTPKAPAEPSPKPAPTKAAPHKPEPEPKPKPTEAPAPAPSKPAVTPPATPAARPTAGGQSAEEAAVVALVNQERAQAGCGPVRANPPLAALARAFSTDMAVRGFFDHTDPDGDTPWDRAAKAGLSGLGAENIARGQGDADAVMKAWMDSPGHRANILNCEYRTLGVGVHLAAGGPWWTQDFGF